MARTPSREASQRLARIATRVRCEQNRQEVDRGESNPISLDEPPLENIPASQWLGKIRQAVRTRWPGRIRKIRTRPRREPVRNKIGPGPVQPRSGASPVSINMATNGLELIGPARTLFGEFDPCHLVHRDVADNETRSEFAKHVSALTLARRP